MDTLKVRRGSGKVATRRIVSFGLFSKFFFLFLCFFYTFTNHLTATLDTLKLRKYLREVTTKRTGPNDANRVVWAISKCFFIFFVFFFPILNQLYRFYDNVEVWMDTQEGTTRKTSPNDAIHVVWANSTCFPFSFRVFFFTDLYLQVLQVLWSYGSTYRVLQ